jgi:hypothetical protein
MPRTQTILALCVAAAAIVAVSAAATAQVSSSATPTPVTYASASELNAILTQVQQTSQSMQADLGKARIDRWKLDATAKRDLQGNADSILRNLQSALPEIIGQLNNAPEDLSASFKLYRNLDALYDVFGPIVESAGALGSKDEFQSLSNDMSALQSARRALGDRMQNLAATKESELARLRNQVKMMQASTPPPPPKKIIVDDTEPPKKPAKKKPAKPPAQKPPVATHPPASPK